MQWMTVSYVSQHTCYITSASNAKHITFTLANHVVFRYFCPTPVYISPGVGRSAFWCFDFPRFRTALCLFVHVRLADFISGFRLVFCPHWPILTLEPLNSTNRHILGNPVGVCNRKKRLRAPVLDGKTSYKLECWCSARHWIAVAPMWRK